MRALVYTRPNELEMRAARRFGPIERLEQRPIADGADAFADLDNARIGDAKVTLRP